VAPRLRAGAGEPYSIADRYAWRLRVNGDVGRPLLFDINDLWELPSRLVSTRLENAPGDSSRAAWEGVHLNTLANLAEARAQARFVQVTCTDGHRDLFTRADLSRPRAIFAHTREDTALGAEQGGPLRLVIPWRRSERSPVAITEVTFLEEISQDADPLRDALAAGEHPVRGYQAGLGDRWADSVARIEMPIQRPTPPAAGSWKEMRPPWRPPDPTQIAEYARGLANESFVLANSNRTNLVLLGSPSIDFLDPNRDWSPGVCPLLAPQVETRLLAHSALAEIDDPASDLLLIEGLQDADPSVQALALDALARRGSRAAISRALSAVSDPDDGLGLTAVAALGLLRGALEEGDRTLAREALEAAQETTQDLTRQAEITRVLTAL